MFDRVGEITYPADAGDAEAMLDAAIEAGADDVQSDEDGHTIYTAFEDMNDVAKALNDALGEASGVNGIWKPQNGTPVDGEKAPTLLKLINALEDDDDVQNVYANFEIDDSVMEALSAA